MQPIKIVIYGNYWDSQIYRGRLYLWSFNGDVKVVKWDDIINLLNIKDEDQLAFNCAFLKGNYLYGYELSYLFNDLEVKKLMQKKFKRLLMYKFELEENEINKICYGIQANPFDELPTDTELYYNELYATTNSGFWKTKAHRYNPKYPISTKPTKLFDCPLLSIKANKFGQIALSAGSEGLFEYDIRKYLEYNNIATVSKRHSLFSSYSSLSIYNSSNIGESEIALYKWNNETSTPKRFLNELISESKIFGDHIERGLSWNSNEKIYRATKNGFDIVDFNNYSETNDFFNNKKNYVLQEWKGNIISGGSSFFGTIIECDNAIIIIQSNDELFTINGPITRWRTFPRSINYENHLHVILDDRLEIYSFNHDYFVEQNDKIFGSKYKNKITKPKLR